MAVGWRSVAYAVILLLGFPSYCLVWGTEGHQIVGKIATEYLTDTSKREITALLAVDLNASGASSGRVSLAEVGVWLGRLIQKHASRS